MKFMRVLSVVMAAVMLFCTCAFADVLTTGNVNLRSGPGTGYGVIATIPEGKRLPYLGDDGNGSWYNVMYDGQEGWISAKYAEIVEDTAPSVVTSGDSGINISPVQEVSVFWKQSLKASAAYIGLTGYQESLSRTPKKYFDADLLIGGNESVELMALHGNRYTIFGASAGMDISAASSAIAKNGMILHSSEGGSIIFSAGAACDEIYSGSTLELKTAEGIVTSIEWKVEGI